MQRCAHDSGNEEEREEQQGECARNAEHGDGGNSDGRGRREEAGDLPAGGGIAEDDGGSSGEEDGAEFVVGEEDGVDAAGEEDAGAEDDNSGDCEKESAAARFPEDKERREEEVEVLFDGEGPEVVGVPAGGAHGEEVAEEEERAEPLAEMDGGENSGKAQKRNYEEISAGGGKDAEDAADIERAAINGAGAVFFVEEEGSDEEAADGEKDVDAVSALGGEPGGAEGAEAVEAVVIKKHQEDGEGAPSVEGRDVKRPHGMDGSIRRGRSCYGDVKVGGGKFSVVYALTGIFP